MAKGLFFLVAESTALMMLSFIPPGCSNVLRQLSQEALSTS